MSAEGRVVLLAGATSAAGSEIARALLEAGARVIATGRSAERLAPLAAAGADVEVSDATSLAAMTALAEKLGAVDGVVPLVGGWRGGGGLAGQTDADFDALLPSLQAVRATSRAFDALLRASSAGRFAIASSTAVERPLAGGANYAAVKAASEAWARAVAQGFAKAARERAAVARGIRYLPRAGCPRSIDARLRGARAVGCRRARAQRPHRRALRPGPPTGTRGSQIDLIGEHPA